MSGPTASSRSALALQIVEDAPNPVVALDEQRRIVFANAEAERLFGLAESQMLGKLLPEILPPMEGSPLGTAIERAFAERRACSLEVRFEHLDRTCEIRLNPSTDGGLSVLFRDVTERRRVEDALRAERQRFSDVLDQLPAYLVLLSPDYHVPFENRFFRERFGESKGRRCYEYLFGRTEPCEVCETYTVLKTGEPHHWEWTGPDRRNYDIYDFPFRDTGGSKLIMEVGLDITERKRVEAELERHREHLQDQVKTRTLELEEANARLQAEIAERKQAQEELARTHARLEAVMRAVPVGVSFSTDVTCQHVTGNPAVLAQFEVGGQDNLSASAPETDAPGRQVRFFRDGQEITDTELPLQRAVREDRIIPSMELEVRLPGGRTWFADASGAPIRDSEGQVVGGVAVTVDITERKRAEEELRRNREWLRVTLNSIGDAVLATDTEGRITFMNPVAVSLTGWNEAECLGQPIGSVFRIINETTKQPAEDAIARALHTRKPIALANHTALIARDGREVPIEDSAAPILDAAGNVAGTVIVFHDVTEHRRAQAAVTAAQAEAVNERNRLRALMEALPVGAALFDAEGGYVQSNPGYDRIWGATRPPTKSVADYAAYKAWWTATGRPVEPEEWGSARASQKGETVVGQEIDIRRFDGTRLSVLNSAAPVRDAEGQVTGSAVAVIDISELRRTQRELRDSEAVLRSFYDSPGVMRGLVELVENRIVHVSCNAAAAELFGMDRQRIAGKTATEAGAPEDVAKEWVVLYERSRQTGQPVSMEYARRDAQGRDRWLLATASYLGTGPSGSPRFAYTILDLTDRKKAEQQLKVTKERLELAQLASGAGSWDWDLVADRLDWSGRQFELFGLDPAKTAASMAAWQAVLHPEDREIAASRIQDALQDRRVLDSEYRIVRPDGEVRWISAIGRGVYDAKDRPVRMAGLCVDITERKQAEEKLRHSEEQYRSLFESMIEGFCLIEMVFDPQGRPVDYWILETNPAFEAQSGLANAKGRLISEILPDNEPHWLEIYGRVAQTGEATRFVNETRTLNRWFEVITYRVGGPGSHKVGIVFSDVTERMHAEEERRDREALFRTLGDNLPEAAIYRYRHDADGAPHVDFVTAGIERLTGVPAAEYMNDPEVVERNFVPEDRDRLKQAILASREGLTQFEQELRHKHRLTGEIRWSLLRATPTRQADGSTVWDGIELDITRRKRAEESVAQSRRKLDAAMASMTDALFISDTEGKFVDFNEAFAKFHRFPSKEACATTLVEYPDILDVFLPDGKPAPLERWAVARALRGETATNQEYTLRRKDSGERWVGSYSFGPIRDKDGAIIGSVVVGRDITELKNAEERLRQSQKLESIGLLAGGVAHDFNNLLVGVVGNASLAQEMLPENHEVADLLARIVKAGEQAAHLTRQMLAYAGKGRFLVEPVNLSELIPEISGLIQTSISKKIAVHLSLDSGLPSVQADRGQMQQIFMNLALNAAEAIGSSAGLIAVKTGVQTVDAAYRKRHPETAELATGDYVCLEVRDTGCGMDEATRARVFDPFFSTKFQGRGLGLAAVAGIVRAHQGAIQLTSAPGEGATFRILLPAMAPAAAAGGKPAVECKRDLRGKGTVLIVDDEPHVCKMAKGALERHGYRVLVAESGAAAIEIVRTQGAGIDLVVLDLGMPVMGGDEVLPHLRALHPELKIMVSSGFSEAETVRAFGGAPLSGFIQKPYTVRELAAEVKAAMA